MKKFANYIVNNNILILVVCLILLVPAIIGYLNTRINYDILAYLPDSNETIKGQKILKNDFDIGSYAFVMIENESSKNILKLENKIKDLEGISSVVSISDITGTTIPKEMLPSEVLNFLYKDNTTILMATFNTGTSEDATINGISKIREIVDANKVSSMTSMIVDMRSLINNEIGPYVVIAVILCLIILLIATDAYVIPIFLLSNIGIAIIYNMGTNFFLGEISYITKAITAILQLGVTTDFSIFLYHKYEQAKKDNKKLSNKENMSIAIVQTFKSVIGSSLTTFAGFLSLCTMTLALGADIGIVMAKGVLFGLLCVLTIFPALLLTFDKAIEKTKHKNYFPKFKKLNAFSIKNRKIIFALFIILLIPAFIGYKNYDVYYKLDDSLPHDLPFHIANDELKEKFNIVSPAIVILNSEMKDSLLDELVDKLKEQKGIDLVLAPSQLTDPAMKELLPDDLKKILANDKYQLIILNSVYETASTDLNKQIKELDELVKWYDESAIIAGEGALMNDLVQIAAHDFNAVTYTSIAVIFTIMVMVLYAIGLPIILIIAIEFAIFLNMACAFYTGASLPFIASILVGTIQLGATIDYAILLSTKYVEVREKEKNKEKAMKKTLDLTVPSIVTSALCFFAATIGVSLYTQIDMIGSICTLLSRGSIISMLVVVLILPSLLMTFDNFIMKTNLKKEATK